MNSVELPVEAYKIPSGLWNVRDADKSRICRDLSESEAREITIALNCHDALVDALKDAHAVLDDGSAESDEGPLLPKIKAALAKVEDLKKP